MGVFDRRQDESRQDSFDDSFSSDLDLENPFGGSGATFGDDFDSPAKTNNVYLTEAFKGAAEGLSDAIGEDIERNMPNVATVFTELKDTYEDFRTLKDEIGKQIAPMMVSMENITRKVLPRVEKLMPKKWYEKAKSALDERAAARSSESSYSEAKAREEQIASELNGMLATGGGGDGSQNLENMKHQEFESNKARLFDRAISSTQFKLNAKVLHSIYDSARSTELFHRTMHTAYLKKSLELKYKHMFIAQDTFNLLAKSVSAFEGYFKGIVHNTSLPDAAKIRGTAFEQGTRTRKYGSLISDFLSNARKNVVKKISNSVKDLLGNLNMATSMGEQGIDMLDQADEMAEMTGEGGTKSMAIRGGARLLSRFLSAGPSRMVFDKLSPYLKFINGEGYDVKERAYLGISKLRDNWSASGNWLKEMLSDFLPNISTAASASNDLLTAGETAVPFDKMVRQSIVEIIPAYLSKILHSTDSIKMGLVGSGAIDRTSMEAAKEQAFNIYRRRITTTDTLESDIYNDPMMFGGTDNQTTAVSKALGAISAGIKHKRPEEDTSKLTKNIEKSVSTIIANSGRYAPHFNAPAILRYVEDPDANWEDPYIQKISRGLSKDKFLAAVRAIKDAITDDKGLVNEQVVSHFKSAIIAAMRSSDGYKTRAPTVFESFGLRWVVANREAVTDAAGNVIQKAKKGIVDDDNKFNADVVDDQIRKYDSKAVQENVDWYSRQTSKHLEDTAEVYEKFRKVKDAVHGNEYFKAASGLFSRLKQKTDDNPSTIFSKFRKLYKDPNRAKKDWDYLKEKFGIENPNDPAQWDKAYEKLNQEAKDYENSKKEASATDAAGAEGSSEKSTKETVAESVAAATSSKQPIALLPAPGEETAPSAPTEAEDTSILGRAKKAWTSLSDKAKKVYDGLPTSEEEVEAKLNEITADAESAIKNRPKSFKEAKRRLKKQYRAYKKNHPEQAAKIDELIKKIDDTTEEVLDSKGAKFVSASAKVAKRKAKKVYKKKFKKHVDRISKPIEEVGEEIVDAISSAAERMSTAEGREAVAAKTKTTAQDAFNTIKDRASKVADWGAKQYEDIKSRFATPEGTPAPSASVDTASSTTEEAAGYRDAELMEFLKTWKDEVNTSHTGLLETTDAIAQLLEKGLTVNGTGGSGEGGASTGKKRKYGVFGKGGHFIKTGIKGAAKGVWAGTKKLGSFYGAALEGYGTVLKGAAKGLVGAGKTLTSLTGLNPYLDVYVKGREKEGVILSWRKQAWGDGVVFVDNKKRVMATKDIDRPVMDPKTGNILITEEDIKAGLWSPGLVSGAFKIANNITRGYFSVATAAWKGAADVAKIVAGGLFGVGGEKEEKYVDVWRKDEVRRGNKPILTRLKQKRNPGVVFKSGERLEKSSDIHEPIYDPVTGEELVSQDDIDHGLVNVHNKPLGSGGKSRQGLLNIIAKGGLNIGENITKGLFGKTGMAIAGLAAGGLASIWKGMFGTLFKAGDAALSGISKLGARLFGFDSKNGFGKKAFDGLNTRLDKIIAILQAWPKGIGGGVGPGGATYKVTESNVEDFPDPEKGYVHTDHRPDEEEGSGEGESGGGISTWMKTAGTIAGTAIFGKGFAKKFSRAGRAAETLAGKKGLGKIGTMALKSRAKLRRGTRLLKRWSPKRLKDAAGIAKETRVGKAMAKMARSKPAKAVISTSKALGKKVAASAVKFAQSPSAQLAISSAKTLGQQAVAKAVMAKNAAVSMGKNVASSKFGQSVASAARSAATTSANITRKAAEVVTNAPKSGGLFSKIGGWFKSAGKTVANVAGKVGSGVKSAVSAAATKVVDMAKAAGRAIGKGVLKIPFIAKALKTPFATKLISTLGKFAAKGGLKVLGWPLMIGWALYDAYAGWRDAAKKLNKPEEEVTTSDKVACAVAGLINSLTLDLGPMVAELLGAEKNGLEKWLAGLFGGSPSDKPSDGVKDSNKLKWATGYVGEYIDANGGIDKALKSKSISEFERDVKEYVSSHPEVEKDSALGRRSEIMKAGMKAKAAYAEAFGVTGQFSIRMGELIDPNTEEPVKREGGKTLKEVNKAEAKIDKANFEARFDGGPTVKKDKSEWGTFDPSSIKDAPSNEAKSAAKAVAKAVTATAATAGGAAAAGKVGKAATDGKTLPKRKRSKAFDEDELIEMFIEEVTPNVAKNMSFTQFSNEVKDFAMKNKSRHELDSDEIDNLDMYTMMHYAPLHGLPKTGKFTVGMGELINPKTGKPVKRDRAVVDKYMGAKQDKLDDAWIARMASGKFSNSEIDKLFKAYIKSVGGISAVAKMDKPKFVEGCAKYVADNEDDPLGDGGDLSRWKHVASKLHNKLTGKTAPTSAAKIPSASIKKTDVVPTSSSQPTTQKELNEAKSAAKSAQQSSQIGPTVEAAKREEAKAAREDRLISTLENYSSVLGKFTGCFSKDGLQVAGMDMLTAVTASRASGSGSTQVINNNNTVVREANEGLDLRKKQW